MTKINVSADCGNSPKNIFLKELTIAIGKGDAKFCSTKVTDDVFWNFVGSKTFQGKTAFAEKIKELSLDKALEITLYHISSHGISGSVNGVIKLESGRIFAFCDVFRFNNTKGEKIKEITSYVIEIK